MARGEKADLSWKTVEWKRKKEREIKMKKESGVEKRRFEWEKKRDIKKPEKARRADWSKFKLESRYIEY